MSSFKDLLRSSETIFGLMFIQNLRPLQIEVQRYALKVFQFNEHRFVLSPTFNYQILQHRKLLFCSH